jgi:hypothetical protein
LAETEIPVCVTTMLVPPLSVASSTVTVAVVVPGVALVHVQNAEVPAIETQLPTALPELGDVPAVTVNRAQIEVGAPLNGRYQGVIPDAGLNVPDAVASALIVDLSESTPKVLLYTRSEQLCGAAEPLVAKLTRPGGLT